MELTTEIRIRKVSHSGIHEVDFEHLEFGKQISDHMLVCDYFNEQWHEAQIVPFANLSLSPATLAFHYGQTVFEGMKAFNIKDGNTNDLQTGQTLGPFVRSLERMCMAVPTKELFIQGLHAS